MSVGFSASLFVCCFKHATFQPPTVCPETFEPFTEVYRRHMELRKKGRHPLWAPQPYLHLPIQYRRRGTQVGDVGIITQDGAFDFMFNICDPAPQASYELANDDSAGLPLGFAPIWPPLREKEVSSRAEHDALDALISQGVSKHIQYVSSERLTLR